MTDLLLSLTLGVALIVLVNLLLVRFTGTSAKQAAATVALVTIGLYTPYSILRWPGGDVFAIHFALYLLASLLCGILLSARANGQGLHWGPATIGGFFILVAVLGGVFVAVAERGLTPTLWGWLLPDSESGRKVTSLFPGVISHNFHQKEEQYNQYLAQVERQRERGWQVQKGWLRDPLVNQPTPFRVAVRTREGQPVAGASVKGQFLRSASSTLDKAFELTEQMAGVYEADLTLAAPGHWMLVLSIRQGEALHEVRSNTQVLER